MNISNSAPLSFEALEDGLSISFSNEILYSIDGGVWETLLEGENTEEVNKGSVISFKHSKSIFGSGAVGAFSINKKCNVFGNCSSIIPEVLGEKFMSRMLFFELFGNCDAIVDASKLELPATTLAEDCYYGMFHGCTNLTSAPELPATTLARHCYGNMFYDCTSLTTAPELPATTLADECYANMFKYCTSLTTAPELPATTLANYCYEYMFHGCTNLTSAPELPATTLADECYEYMFQGCTSLTTAPVLPATTLANYCYRSMFQGCTKLKYIKMLATNISANRCLYNWVKNVASSGTFVKNTAMTTLPTATSSNYYAGIPSGWTVVNDGEEGGGKTINYIRMSYEETGPDEYGVNLKADFIPASTIIFEMDGRTTNMYGALHTANLQMVSGVPTLERLTYSPKEDDTYIYEVIMS